MPSQNYEMKSQKIYLVILTFYQAEMGFHTEQFLLNVHLLLLSTAAGWTPDGANLCPHCYTIHHSPPA